MVFWVVVRDLNGKQHFIDLCDTEEQFKTITTWQLIEKIRERTDYSPDRCYLVFACKELADDRLLCDYGIQHRSEIHFRLNLRGGGTPEGDGGIGDKDKSQSMDRLANFKSECQML